MEKTVVNWSNKSIWLLSHDLLTAKLHVYGLDLASLNLLQNYITNRKQKTKVGTFYSTWEKMLSVPQGFTFIQCLHVGHVLYNVEHILYRLRRW